MSSNGTLNGRRRVVVTGLGAVSPLGNDVETSWRNLIAGESGAAPITQFDHADYKVHFACEVKDFDPTTWIDRKEARRMDRFAHLVLAARPTRPRKTQSSTSRPSPSASARRSRPASGASVRSRTATTR
jgi:3-oxoacyl-(acyl-carrier-protein) synthase